MMRAQKNAAGTIIVMLALFLLLLLCFVAFATEAGRWYLVRAELSKSVDAGALAAAKNISNPHVSVTTLAREFCLENFQSGAFGTPTSGGGAPSFGASTVDFDKVAVQGTTTSPAILAQLLNIHDVSVSSASLAQKREAEIMLTLDRSGSMAGTPMTDLKRAAKSFVSFFSTTQDKDKVGLISFATSVSVDRVLGINFVGPINTAIDGISANGATNAEDAIDQCDGPSGFTDQSGVVGDRRIQQFLIFFSDGRPTAIRDEFMQSGAIYEAVGCVTGNCGANEIGGSTVTYGNLGRTNAETWLNVDPTYTGDGKIATASKCGSNHTSTRWYAFDDAPVPGYAVDACHIPPATTLASWLCAQASSRALAHAQELKNEGVIVFAIGLGTTNPAFLQQLATSPDLVYYTPTSDQLQSIFQRIAMEIKLRLVQ